MARKFRGSEDLKVDAKGRVSIPARFRRVFEAADAEFGPGKRAQLVIVYGPEEWRHLRLYTMEAIAEVDEEISRMPRGSDEREVLEKIMNGYADGAEIDNDGRLVLPLKLREKLGLTDAAFLIASGDYMKLWEPGHYREQERESIARVPGFDLSRDDPMKLASRVVTQI